MASPHQLLKEALTDLCLCLGCAYIPPLTPAAYASLLQSVGAWASPGTDSASAPERATAACKASLRFVEALKALSRDEDHTKTSQAVPTARAVTSETAEASGKPVCFSIKPKSDRGEANTSKSPEDGRVAPDTDKAAVPNIDVSELAPMHAQCILRCVTVPILLMCGSHMQVKPWTNSHSQALSKQLLKALLDALQFKSVAELLKGKHYLEPPYSIFKEILGLLGPWLRKDTWEIHPDAKILFSWMLFHVPRPWLSDFLSIVMPPSLLFSDDYKAENKVLGISCLHHIIKNVPAADLRQYNRAMVVYHALLNHLYTTEVEVIQVALPCLLDLIPILEKPQPVIGGYRKDKQNPSDQVLQMILTQMEMEHKLVLRRLYARNLRTLQERLGIQIIRHMKRLLRVIVSYLEVHDGPEETTRLFILDILQGTIKYAWPRIPSRLPLLLKSLLKLMYELCSDPSKHSEPVTEALFQAITECLLLLNRCCKGQVKVALKGIPSICNEPLLVKCINRVLQDT